MLYSWITIAGNIVCCNFHSTAIIVQFDLVVCPITIDLQVVRGIQEYYILPLKLIQKESLLFCKDSTTEHFGRWFVDMMKAFIVANLFKCSAICTSIFNKKSLYKKVTL